MNITVLGVGNPIMGDDGVGLEILHELKKIWNERTNAAADHQHSDHTDSCCTSDIEFVEGGTAGMELVPTVQEAHKLLILDAVEPAKASAMGLAHASTDMAYPPGACVNISGDQVPRLLSTKMSPHQVGLLDVLTACRLLGTEPDDVRVVGIVPVSVDLRVGLSPKVQASVVPAARQALEILQEWQRADSSPIPPRPQKIRARA